MQFVHSGGRGHSGVFIELQHNLSHIMFVFTEQLRRNLARQAFSKIDEELLIVLL